jgi:uncharacterized protein
MVKLLRRLLQIVFFTYLPVMLAMFAFQRDLMYHPEGIMQAPEDHGLPQAEAITLTTTDELRLTAWLIPPKEGKPLILYFHGNAGNLSGRINKMKAFTAHGMGLLALSYRGYGGNPGMPSERGLYEDARAALRYVKEILKLPPERLILYGESLGSGVAVQMAVEWEVGLVALEAPYTSTAERGAELYPWLPVRTMMLDRFESLQKIGKVTEPLLIFHNAGDEVIPIEDGKKIYAAANRPKRAFWFRHGNHSDFNWDKLEQEIARFYTKHLPMKKGTPEGAPSLIAP